MNDPKPMGSVAELLLNYVSTTHEHDVNFSIAVTMLNHYRELGSMSAAEIAELCHVSNASISRFCRHLGFDHFKEFHHYLGDSINMSTDYSRSFFDMLCADRWAAMDRYQQQLSENIQSTFARENLDKLPEMARILHDSRRVAFFSHHFLWDIGRHMQNKFLVMGRCIERYFDYSFQLECARSLGPEDTALVCTVGGSYPTRYGNIWSALQNNGSRLLIITQNRSSAYWNNASYVLNCGSTNQNDVGKYSALLAADLLVMHYLRQYGRDFF